MTDQMAKRLNLLGPNEKELQHIKKRKRSTQEESSSMLGFERSHTDDQIGNMMTRYYKNLSGLQQQRSLNPNIFRTAILEQEEEHEELLKQDTAELDLISAAQQEQASKDMELASATPKSHFDSSKMITPQTGYEVTEQPELKTPTDLHILI